MNLTHALPIAALLAAPLAHAQQGGMQGMDMHKGQETMSQQKEHPATGTVKSVDAAKATVTIDHQAINSINWPAMTMTFKAGNKAMLQGLRPGDKVDFSLVRSGSDYTVMRIKPRK